MSIFVARGAFFPDHPRMSWFSKSQSVEAEPAPATNEDRLAEINLELCIAEAEFNEACQAVVRYTQKDSRIGFVNGNLIVRVNALHLEPERMRLEGARHAAWQKRNQMLEQRARVMKDL